MTRTGRYQRCISALHCLEASGALALGVMFVTGVIATPSVQAQTYAVVHRFKGSPTDGSSPTAGVIRDSAGNLYGTTYYGGAGYGVVFKLDKTGETVLYSFTGGADGSKPVGGLIRDSAGNLYGTTDYGGASGAGVVFKLETTGTETVLYSFTGGADGGQPLGGLIRDSADNLYGTTIYGGAGYGVVFKLDTAGTETVLHSFRGRGDGGNPEAGLIGDSAGNLYGTTHVGGDAGYGVVFKLDAARTETVLHSFKGADGSSPTAGVIRDSAGNLYGTTSDGGASDYGVVFKLDTAGTETVLHSFKGGADGRYPEAGLFQDAAGNLYGTTSYGGIFGGACGSYGCGVVFKLDTTGTETVLYSFTGGADGGYPYAGLLQDAAGNLHGTASGGGIFPGACGSGGCGVVFKLQP